MVKKMFIEITLCNPIAYVFKGHVKIIKILVMKFNVSFLNKLEIMDSLSMQSIQENAMRYNNRDNLLQLSFTLEMSIFSEFNI